MFNGSALILHYSFIFIVVINMTIYSFPDIFITLQTIIQEARFKKTIRHIYSREDQTKIKKFTDQKTLMISVIMSEYVSHIVLK